MHSSLEKWIKMDRLILYWTKNMTMPLLNQGKNKKKSDLYSPYHLIASLFNLIILKYRIFFEHEFKFSTQ